MDQEWISLNEYMRRNKMGYETVVKLMHSGKLEYQKIGKQCKIKVTDKDLVTREEYNKVLERAIKAETKLENIEKILV
mgnify:CR=1 FL=1